VARRHYDVCDARAAICGLTATARVQTPQSLLPPFGRETGPPHRHQRFACVCKHRQDLRNHRAVERHRLFYVRHQQLAEYRPGRTDALACKNVGCIVNAQVNSTEADEHGPRGKTQRV
jgi:hypothetical protein